MNNASAGGTPAPTAAAQPARAPRHYPWQIFSGTTLKWIAIAAMLVDHTAIVLVATYYAQLRGALDPSWVQWREVYDVMRHIGRIAFPLFCFALTEGFSHTHSKPRYIVRLLGFAIVSEVPFDLALQDGVVDYTSSMNVMFTLLIAFMALWAADSIGKVEKLPSWGTGLLIVAFSLAGAVVANELDTDYHAFGVLLVGGFYLARRSRVAQVAMGAALTWWYCVQHGSWLEMWNLIGMACILFYNGKRGRGMKYFFYVFYPGHLLLLWLIKLALFG